MYEDLDDIDIMDQQQNIHTANVNVNLGEKSFIYLPRGTQQLTILDMYLPKLSTKMIIDDDKDLISFYNTFRASSLEIIQI